MEPEPQVLWYGERLLEITLACTSQEWIVFFVLTGDKDKKDSMALNLDSSPKFSEC